MHGLYIHIPFCVRKCIYCDFYSVETSRKPLAQRLRETTPDQPAFLDALEREMDHLPSGFSPTTLFIGGGTPTELSDADFDRLLCLIHRKIDLHRVREWTCESNPGTLTLAKAQSMKNHGINRVSLGVQTLSPALLAFLGRIHGPEDIPIGVDLLRSAGIRNINLDFIFGIPGAENDQALSDARAAIKLHPEHLSFYCLMFEQGTPLQQLKEKGFVQEADGGDQRKTYETLSRFLNEHGFSAYELSNYARPGRSCLHNRLYWYGQEYMGLGPSAHSHWDGVRWANTRKLSDYLDRINREGHAREEADQISADARAREALMVGLRLTQGLDTARFEARHHCNLRELCGDLLSEWERDGWLENDGRRIRLHPNAHFISDQLFAELV